MAKVTREAERRYTQFLGVVRKGELFTITARSGGIEHPGTVDYDYVLALMKDLAREVIAYEAEHGIRRPAFNDIGLAVTPEGGIAFTLLRKGKISAAGEVTAEVCEKAKAFLDGFFNGPKVVPIGKRRAG